MDSLSCEHVSAVTSDDDDDCDGNMKQFMSEFESRQQQLTNRIEQLQAENLSAKTWQLSGEACAYDRPPDSALIEEMQFDQVQRLPPVITRETTEKIEAIIKQRIADKIFDDVIRKQKPIITPYQYREQLELDSSKSKKSLAQIYEEEFVKLNQPIDPRERSNPKHADIDKHMRELFTQLDALSNYYYTPETAKPQVAIVANVHSMHKEEVAQTMHSDATTLAPEQILAPSTSAPYAPDERTETERLHERRVKKKTQHNKAAKNEQAEVVEKTRKRMKETGADRHLKAPSVRLFNRLQREAKANVDALAKRGKYGDEITKQRVKSVTAKPKKKKRRR